MAREPVPGRQRQSRFDVDARFLAAIGHFWAAREAQQRKQVEAGRIDVGSRGAVTGGTQMGALEVLVADLDPGDIRVRTALALPGYYRPEKKWDLLVVANGRLVMALEFKSQVGPSFGNNFNNRTEEAVGSASDIWVAYREGRFGVAPAPFLGYFFLLEDCPAVHTPTKNSQPYFAVDPAFTGASYARRYEILCERLVLERLYTACCLALSTRETPVAVRHPSTALSFSQFALAIQAHARLFLSTSAR